MSEQGYENSRTNIFVFTCISRVSQMSVIYRRHVNLNTNIGLTVFIFNHIQIISVSPFGAQYLRGKGIRVQAVLKALKLYYIHSP